MGSSISKPDRCRHPLRDECRRCNGHRFV